jgi:L-asparaginase
MSKIQLHTSKGNLKKALLIYTGGTFGMKPNLNKGFLEPFGLAVLADLVPEIKQFNFGIDLYTMPNILDSSNIGPDQWLDLARVITTEKDNYGAFVVLHGTDTMTYTSAAISFLLRGFSSPIIFTGAQLPLHLVRNDARENLITSLVIAGQRLNNEIELNEVCICFGQKLLRANRATKIDNQDFEAFDSFNDQTLADVGVDIRYKNNFYFSATVDYYSLKLNPSVALIKYFPGLSAAFLNSVFNLELHKVVIIETFGVGNLPENPALISALKSYIDLGACVYTVSQSLGGKQKQSTYQTGTFLTDLGVIGLADMTAAAALTKAMVLLGEGRLKDMTTNLCGELTLE